MDMSIDKPGDHPLPSRVYCLRASRHSHIVAGADIANAPAVDNDRRIAYDRASGTCDHGSALNDSNSVRLLRREQADLPVQEDRSDKETEHCAASLPRTHACLPRAGFEFPFAP